MRLTSRFYETEQDLQQMQAAAGDRSRGLAHLLRQKLLRSTRAAVEDRLVGRPVSLSQVRFGTREPAVEVGERP